MEKVENNKFNRCEMSIASRRIVIRGVRERLETGSDENRIFLVLEQESQQQREWKGFNSSPGPILPLETIVPY